MNAPDKIYVGIQDLGNGYATDVCLTPREGDYDEYIRKDALMEWAKETYLNENASAVRKVCYKQLIDKLNSM